MERYEKLHTHVPSFLFAGPDTRQLTKRHSGE